MESLYVASSGAIARLQQLETVANNIANAQTVGFRADASLFETAFENAWIDDQDEFVGGAGALAQVQSLGRLTSKVAGPISHTGGPLDVAIIGDGYFELDTPAGPRYTRAGDFSVSPEGRLIGAGGHPVQGEGGPIETGGAQVRIQRNGSIVDPQGNEVGRLAVHQFPEDAALAKEGQNLYRAPEGVTPEVADARLEAESLEQSNVQSVQEIAALIVLQRAFDASMQSLQETDDRSRRLIEEAGS